MTEQQYLDAINELYDPVNIDCEIGDIISGKHLTKPILSDEELAKRDEELVKQKEVEKVQQEIAKENMKLAKQQEKNMKESKKEEKITKSRATLIEEIYNKCVECKIDKQYDVKTLNAMSDAELLQFKCQLEDKITRLCQKGFKNGKFVMDWSLKIIEYVEKPLPIIDGYSKSLRECDKELEMEIQSLIDQGKLDKIFNLLTPQNALFLTLGRNLIATVTMNLTKKKGFSVTKLPEVSLNTSEPPKSTEKSSVTSSQSSSPLFLW